MAVLDMKDGLSARPWNRFQPDDSLWWLVPSKDWPAYRHGKCAFCTEYADPGELFAGLNVEKGFGAATTSVLPSVNHNQVVGPNWVWRRLVEPAGATSFGAVLTSLPASLKPRLILIATYAQDPRDFDPYAERPRNSNDRLHFASGPHGLSLTHADIPTRLLEEAASCATFSELAERLCNLRDHEWVWVDMYAGVSAPSGQNLDIGRMYRESLRHFEPWLL